MKFKQLIEGIHDQWLFKAIFLIGGAGSGKNLIQKKLFHSFRNLDPDKIREFLYKKRNIPMDYRKQTGEQKRQRFGDIDKAAYEKTKAIEKGVLAGRLPVAMNYTGKDYENTRKMKEQLESLGYETKMIFVKTELSKAQERNLARKRKLEPKMVERIYKDVGKNIGKFRSLFGNSFHTIDNTKHFSETKVEAEILWRKIAKWMDWPVNNDAAIKWRKENEIKRTN